MSVPDESYSRKGSHTLNLISTFSLLNEIDLIKEENFIKLQITYQWHK